MFNFHFEEIPFVCFTCLLYWKSFNFFGFGSFRPIRFVLVDAHLLFYSIVIHINYIYLLGHQYDLLFDYLYFPSKNAYLKIVCLSIPSFCPPDNAIHYFLLSCKITHIRSHASSKSICEFGKNGFLSLLLRRCHVQSLIIMYWAFSIHDKPNSCYSTSA